MADPRNLDPADFEILAPREIRKAGVEARDFRVLRRVRLVDERGDTAGFALEIGAELIVGDEVLPALIVCRSEPEALAVETIDAVARSAVRAGTRYAIVFTPSGYAAEAVARAHELGIPLLLVVDGREAFSRGAWAVGGPTPSWVPEYMAEVVFAQEGKTPMQELIEAGRPGQILDRLRDLGEGGISAEVSGV